MLLRVIILCILALAKPQVIPWNRSYLNQGQYGYSKLTINIGQNIALPKNCETFLNNLEVLLNTTSYNLFEISKQQGWFSDIQVLLPSSWNTSRCFSGRDLTSTLNPSRLNADIDVVSFSGTSVVWQQQHDGCQTQGLKILASKDIFEGYQDVSSVKYSAKELVKSWFGYRYGTFPEYGLEGDPLFPNTFVYGNKTVPNSGCQTLVDNSTEPNLFCGPDSYNRRAPTKQNIFCSGSSALETVLNHKDFKNSRRGFLDYRDATRRGVGLFLREEETTGSPIPHFRIPKFTYIFSRPSRYVLLLDRSLSMVTNDRWSLLRKSLLHFVSAIPDGAEVSIVTFSQQAVMNLSPTVVSEWNRSGLHGRIPRRATNLLDACLECGFDTAFKALHNHRGDIIPATLIVVTGSEKESDKFDVLSRILENAALQIFTIGFPTTVFPKFLSLSKFGQHYSVSDISSTPDPLKISGQLSRIFIDIVARVENKPIHQVFVKEHGSFKVEGTFLIEKAMNKDLIITLTVDDEDKIEYFEVTSPGGKKKMFPTYVDSVVFFSLSGLNEAGLWSYSAKLYPDSTSAPKTLVDVIASASQEEAVQMEAFSNWKMIQNASETPLKIFAKLSSGNFPVLGAVVVALIHRPGNLTENPPIRLPLFDNGEGSPDVTADDGIYSSYFPFLSSSGGFYSVEILATGINSTKIGFKARRQEKCCGSVVNYERTLICPAFQRFVSGGSFYSETGIDKGRDLTPPGRIVDLRQVREVNNSTHVTFQWTSTGQDFLFGKASYYLMEYRRVQDSGDGDVVTNIDQKLLPKPAEAGILQQSSIHIQEKNQMLFFTIVAVDKNGNKSPPSNEVGVYIYESPRTTTTTTITTTATSTTTSSSVTATTLSNEADEPTNDTVTVIGKQPRFEKFAGNDGLFYSTSLPVNGTILNDEISRPSSHPDQFFDKIATFRINTAENVEPLTRNGTTSSKQEPYSEEVKLKIYAATGVISTLLVVAILGFTVMTVKKRNDRKMPFAFSDRVDQSRKSQLDISNPLQPWTTNTDVRDAFPNLIRSNAWFDSLHRPTTLRQEPFINPIAGLYGRERDVGIATRQSRSASRSDSFSEELDLGSRGSPSRHTTATDNSSTSTLDGRMSDFVDRVYVNYPVVDVGKTINLRKSKSFNNDIVFRRPVELCCSKSKSARDLHRKMSFHELASGVKPPRKLTFTSIRQQNQDSMSFNGQPLRSSSPPSSSSSSSPAPALPVKTRRSMNSKIGLTKSKEDLQENKKEIKAFPTMSDSLSPMQIVVTSNTRSTHESPKEPIFRSKTPQPTSRSSSRVQHMIHTMDSRSKPKQQQSNPSQYGTNQRLSSKSSEDIFKRNEIILTESGRTTAPPPKSFADKISDELAFLNVELFDNAKGSPSNGAKVTDAESPPSLHVEFVEKESPEVIVKVEQKSSFTDPSKPDIQSEISSSHYDVPNEPPLPTLPPRAPRGSLASKGTLKKESKEADFLW